MSLTFIIYLADFADKYHNHVVPLVLIATTMYLIIQFGIITNASEDKEVDTWSERWLKIKTKVYIGFFISFLGLVIPKKDTIYLMAASSTATKMVESKDFKDLYQKLYDSIMKKLDEVSK